MISFDLSKDRDVAAQEVRDKVSVILGDLPKDAESPIVQSFDPGAIPVVTIAVSGPGSQRDISEFVDKNLRRRLETVSGVGQALVIGARPRQINVIVDNAKLSGQGYRFQTGVRGVRRALSTRASGGSNAASGGGLAARVASMY